MTIETERPFKPLFEESIVVFTLPPDSPRSVISKRASQLGRKASHRYKNSYGETVRWTFRELLEIQEIMGEELKDGTEIYFRWWDNPSDRKLKLIRESHEESWWT
jgi:hypothetical protein